MDGVTAIRNLETAIMCIQRSIDILIAIGGLEDEVNALCSTRVDLMSQLHELECIEAE